MKAFKQTLFELWICVCIFATAYVGILVAFLVGGMLTSDEEHRQQLQLLAAEMFKLIMP